MLIKELSKSLQNQFINLIGPIVTRHKKEGTIYYGQLSPDIHVTISAKSFLLENIINKNVILQIEMPYYNNYYYRPLFESEATLYYKRLIVRNTNQVSKAVYDTLKQLTHHDNIH